MTEKTSKQSSRSVCVSTSSHNGQTTLTPPWIEAHLPSASESALACTIIETVATMTDKKESCTDSICHGRSNGEGLQTTSVYSSSSSSSHGTRKQYYKSKGSSYIGKGMYKVYVCVFIVIYC